MKVYYHIKDIRSEEFYWRGRIDEGFSMDVRDATKINSEEEALEELNKNYLQDLFAERILEVIKCYHT